MERIGFATEYYTLWDVTNENQYFTDTYGNHHLQSIRTNFCYIKNISKDLSIVEAKYPGVSIDEELRGKHSSWHKTSEVDLCPEILKFGKYFKKSIQEVSEIDFGYILWLLENGKNETRKVCLALPKVIEYLAKKEAEENKLIADNDAKFEAIVKAGFFEFIPERNLRRIDDGTAYIYTMYVDGINVTFKFKQGTFSENEYNGFPYGLPLVKGKSKRMKGKNVRFEFTKSTDLNYCTDIPELYTVIVNNVTISKTKTVEAC